MFVSTFHVMYQFKTASCQNAIALTAESSFTEFECRSGIYPLLSCSSLPWLFSWYNVNPIKGYKCIKRNIFIHQQCLQPVLYNNEPVQECEIADESRCDVSAYLEDDSFDAFDDSLLDAGPAPLKHQPYYKPDFDRTDAIQSLKQCRNGTFIIRVRKENDRFPYAMSINSNGKILHAKVAITPNGRYHLDGKESFESIEQMMDHYKTHGIGNRIAGNDP